MTLSSDWANWQKQNQKKFLDENGAPLPVYMANMLAYHGRIENVRCASCRFRDLKTSRCSQLDNHVVRKSWPACGKHQIGSDDKNRKE